MKATLATAGLCTMVLSLAVPAMLLAQEPAPATPVPVEEAPAEPPPVEPPPAEEPPAEPPAAEEAPPAVSSQASAPAPAPVAKASASVQMIDYAFSPASVTINVGDSVNWSNTGEEDHDAAGSGFSTGTVGSRRLGLGHLLERRDLLLRLHLPPRHEGDRGGERPELRTGEDR